MSALPTLPNYQAEQLQRMSPATGRTAAKWNQTNDRSGPFLSFDLRSGLSAQLPFKALGFYSSTAPCMLKPLRTAIADEVSGAVCAVLQADTNRPQR